MLVQQQRVVDNMIKYLETVENMMRELEKGGGIPTPLPVPGESFIVFSALCFCCASPAACYWCRVPAACFS